MAVEKNVLDELLEQLKEINSPKLWDAKDIGDYLRLKKSTVQSHILCREGFPKAVKIGGTKRWVPEEIQEWAKKNREAA